ncbi:ABC transporter permease, partial [Gleimia europaea]|nr:ABC transporter permease [Gleimia europaea]
MIKIALRDVWAHATRFLMTILSVVLGVAFLSGTLALRTSLEDTFVQSFASTTFGTIQVEGNPISDDSSQRARIDAGAADTIRGINGVKDAQPVYMSPITVLQDGSPATGVGTVTLATGTLTGFTPWTIEGKTPRSENEIAFEAAALKRYDLAVGDRIEYIAG